MSPQLNNNSYATKKSMVQGMLDLALLSSTANQLKYVLTVEPRDRTSLYGLIMGLIIASICLQLVQVILCVTMCLVLDISSVNQQRRAELFNDVCVMIVVVVISLNVIINTFDVRASFVSVVPNGTIARGP